MRKVLLSLLLAGVASSPAFASPPGGPDQVEAREQRSQARAERQAARQAIRAKRAERLAVDERRSDARQQPSFAGRQAPQAQRRERQSFGERRFSRHDAAPVAVDDVRVAREGRGENIDQVQRRFERQQAMRDARLRQSTGREPEALRSRSPLVVSKTPRPGTQPPMRVEQRRSPAAQWSQHWRGDRRYNWQDHRRRHRSTFRVGIYYDPFGWNYNRYQVGWRMWPSYYSSRYWIHDPWMYRLPYAPPGYRWIRYWDDALLVDTWSGQVVDMIPSFFW